ncbi:MAG: hypothetical protein AAGF57_01460 [Pseudomonadota bacterium]
MPKTAGLSFRAALEAHFKHQLRPDYSDYPLAHTPKERRDHALRCSRAIRTADFQGVGCVHGHFLPIKYQVLAEASPCTFVTWLREPLARLISHYDYWQRSYDPASSSTSALHRRVIEENWSLQRFALSYELRNVYSEFLWGFPLERLKFVGIVEFFEEELRYFSRQVLGNKLVVETLNVREEGKSGAPEQRLTPSDRAEIEAFHANDVQLYQSALRWRKCR